LIRKFVKAVAVGALTGIVFSILCVAFQGAGIILLISTLDLGWDLQWIPSVPVIMLLGALGGGLFSAVLFIKDRYIPYVEEVPDFEADAEDTSKDPFDR
jgi:predicted lysophospholipase L1 biosynthesis ABC-type transport system permease subunit